MTTESNSATRPKPPSFRKIFLNRNFIQSALIPLLLFYIFKWQKRELEGIIISGIWCVGVVIYNLIRDRKVNALAVLTGTISAIGLTGTIIMRSPTFYLMAPVFTDILFAFVFFGSLWAPRPLIQVFAEDAMPWAFPEGLRKSAKYREAWVVVTVAWGILNITQGALRAILLTTTPVATYYTISTIYNQLSALLLMAFSYFFPKWYWEHH